jgi:hypothetical protein
MSWLTSIMAMVDAGTDICERSLEIRLCDVPHMLKVKALLLGAPAQKEQFPNTIWPGSIPGMPPIGLRMSTYFQTTGRNRNNFRFVP